MFLLGGGRREMRPRPEDAVWCLIMFDLPVQTKTQRREATKFRKLLVDSGYALIQYSIYGKYSPTIQSNMAIERFIKAHLPQDGEVRMLHLTDCQWSTATRIVARKPCNQEGAPEQFSLF